MCIRDRLMMVNTRYATATDEENAQIDTLKSIVLKYDPNGYLTGEGAMKMCIRDRPHAIRGGLLMHTLSIVKLC